MGDEHHRQGQVDGEPIEVERVAGGNDQADRGTADAQMLQLAHHLGQHGIGRGGAGDDQQLLAEIAQERQQANPAQAQHATEHRQHEERAGEVEHHHQGTEVAEGFDAVLAGGEGHRAEHAQGRQAHDHGHDAEDHVAELIDQPGDAAGLLAHQVQGAAEQHGEQQDLEDVVLGEGAEHRRRDQAQEEGHRPVHCLGPAAVDRRIAGREVVQVDARAVAQADAVGDHQADDQGEGGQHLEVDHRLQADAPHLLQVAGAGHTIDHHAEDDQGDQHLDQLDETIAKGFQLGRQLGQRNAA
ncbi:hypothetical protein D3C85_742710 [compost metagenome]